MQVINFRDDAAVAWSGKWQIRLLSRASLLSSPVSACVASDFLLLWFVYF